MSLKSNCANLKPAPKPPERNHDRQARKYLILALTITGIITVAEIIGGIWADSLSLLADAGHMAVDSSGLIIALIAATLMLKPQSEKHTWGFARAEVLAAALQAGMLLVISAIVCFNALERFLHPQPVEPLPMALIGIIGLIANIFSLLLLSSSKNYSLNMRAAFLEVLGDTLGSIAVVLAAFIIWQTGWISADTVASLFVVALMVPRASKLLAQSISILLQATPAELSLKELRAHFCRIPGVEDVHDLHVSTIRTGLVELSAHVALSEEISNAERIDILHRLEECTAEHFPLRINHTTFQLDSIAHSKHENLPHNGTGNLHNHQH
ncbi:cation diffusion facilitator family transporter [Actinomycetaceae bacterium TAE3-ERU4]|nr:cation diffusion facilitator family transporter [Actinomycetaceae bacterium TAE3-ERU4]